MRNKSRLRITLIAALLAAVFILSVAFSVEGQRRSRLLSWPKKTGVYITNSSETIPAFPRILSGYRSENNKDFWGHGFSTRGTIRIFEGHNWEGLSDFPAKMNDCSN